MDFLTNDCPEPTTKGSDLTFLFSLLPVYLKSIVPQILSPNKPCKPSKLAKVLKGMYFITLTLDALARKGEAT